MLDRAPSAAARRRQADGRPRGPCQGVLHGQVPRDRRLGSRAARRQRHRRRLQSRAVLYGLRSALLLRRHLSDAKSDSRQSHHGFGRLRMTPNLANVLYEKKDGIAYVTVNRPKVLNALNTLTWKDLRTAFEDVRDDATVRGAILTGAGNKAFIAGADIGELAQASGFEAEQSSRFGQEVLDLLENLGKPVIAAVNGFALGGGCETAMACTVRLAVETAKFGQPEVTLGLVPGGGGTQRLPRLVGKGRAP